LFHVAVDRQKRSRLNVLDISRLSDVDEKRVPHSGADIVKRALEVQGENQRSYESGDLERLR